MPLFQLITYLTKRYETSFGYPQARLSSVYGCSIFDAIAIVLEGVYEQFC